MKKYYSIACALFSALFFAQQNISFELSEGFMAVNIDGQNGWTTTPTGGVPANVTHQVICTDNASDGSNSLKIVKENMYGTQSEPIIGAFYNLPTMLSVSDFSVSFDINMSQLNGSVFGFQGVDNVNEVTLVRMDFDKTGEIKVLNTAGGVSDLILTSVGWQPNVWSRFKIVGTALGVRYYLNDTLMYTSAVAGALNMDQLRFVHDNASGVAYIDNVKISNTALMAVKNTALNTGTVSLSPNPATDYIRISASDKIKEVEIYGTAGKKITAEALNGVVDVRNFPAGLYLMTIKTGDKTYTEKFIKK
ncbi:T9SS type A sorting domain-containing protein [Chryseobacterium sp.]|uniref:T9SS type A sorting domain-containing protein n=1 Tax=Chryseobacterium sp. TaxID=1871047 RepID=UPI0025C7036F|nr:T9SS type A sorting domain-containing protein [Chryseobacterium sp.]MBV8327598.1 T9SS type A sorting domain-containing protein [Chryseobacterium sp.]